MVKSKKCLHCKKKFTPCSQVPAQKYCSDKACQAARKNYWNRKKLSLDSDYRANRKEAQKKWVAKNPDYWEEYRNKNNDYVNKNREKQHERNRKNKEVRLCSRIAKTDESPLKNIVLTGRYRLIPVCDNVIAKTDESIVEIRVISRS